MLWFALALAVLVVAGIALVYRGYRSRAAVEADEPPPQLQVRQLSARTRERAGEAWSALQGRFADEPEASIRAADRLLQDVMRERGYPSGDFGRVIELVTAEDAEVLAAYRALHFISVKSETGSISEDEIAEARGAAQHLFERLAGTDSAGPAQP